MISRTWLTCFFTSLALSVSAQVPPASKVAIPLTVELDRSAQAITLRWRHNPDFEGNYLIGRKERWEQFFTQIATVVPTSSQIEWTDSTLVVGVPYEYAVLNTFTTTINGQVVRFTAAGYVCTGIDPFMPPYRGRVLLVVDSSVAIPLAAELSQLKQNLLDEGWKVATTIVPRTEQFNAQAVRRTKDSIRTWYQRSGDEPATAFLIGRVAVPYSGLYYQGQYIPPPDGHNPDHRGAWPCDGYYGCLDNEQGWTDQITDTAGVTRPENRNLPGDGKFDNAIFPAPLSIRTGRIDFYNLPVLTPQGSSDRQTELALLKDYFARNHAYRSGQTQYIFAGLIDDNFKSYPELFARSAWISFPQLVGAANVREEKWFPTLDSTTRLFAYGCGAGSYTSAAGIGNVNDFATRRVRAVFTMLFGSYFGDWDSRNNLMRVALARGGLTCAWSGRPVWYLHTMAVGETIGDVALTMQNLSPFQGQSTYVPSSAQGWVHVALLGDPTLRINYGSVPQPRTLSARQDGRQVIVEWQPPLTTGDSIVGYYVYRTDPGKEERELTPTPISATRFTDSARIEGTVRYTIRAVGRVSSPSGAFLDLSKPVSIELTTTTVAHSNENNPIRLEVSPNPVESQATIRLRLDGTKAVRLAVISLDGRVVAQLYDGIATGEVVTQWLPLQHAAGVYAIVATVNGTSIIHPIIVR